jgi:flagellar motor switch protein FliN/FliY
VTAARGKGLDVQLTTVLGEAPTWSPGASGWIRSGEGAPHVSHFEWKLSSALATALVTTWHEPDAPKAVGIPETKDAGPSTAAKLPSKFDLLMDVELEVMLRFGGRNILLKEILELGPGSVLELDRDIQDEADLFLDGKLIARGEVVAVEGNFGLRVTEVLAHQGSS